MKKTTYQCLNHLCCTVSIHCKDLQLTLFCLYLWIIFSLSWKQMQKKMILPSHSSPELRSRGHMARQWFMHVCNWVLIKSVSGAHVIVCFQDPPCVSLCVIGCYRCCECMSGLKERVDRLQWDCSLENASKNIHIFIYFMYFKGRNFI